MSVTNPSWNLSDNMTNDCWSSSSYSHSMFSFSLLGSSALCRLSEVDEGWLRKISEDEVISSWIIDSSCLYSSQWEQNEQGSWHLTLAQICILTSTFCPLQQHLPWHHLYGQMRSPMRSILGQRAATRAPMFFLLLLCCIFFTTDASISLLFSLSIFQCEN